VTNGTNLILYIFYSCNLLYQPQNNHIMKKTAIIIFSFLLVVFFALSVYAQQEDNQLYYCIKNIVKPEKIDEFKELQKKFASACKEYNYPFAYSAWQSSTPDFYFFWPVKDYNEAKEVMNKAWGDVIPNIEQDWGAKYQETVDAWDDFFIKSIDNLSYNPETSVDGLVYAEWWITYPKPGTGSEFNIFFKRAIEMDQKANFEYPIFRFQSDIGMSRPAIITVMWGKNPADLYAHSQEDGEILGEEVLEMWNDLKSKKRKSEKIPFWYMEDSSYSPE